MNKRQSLRSWLVPTGAIIISTVLILNMFYMTSVRHDNGVARSTNIEDIATTCQQNNVVPNTTYSFHIAAEKGNRTYLVHTPPHENLAEPQSVVFAFGGKGMGQNKFEQISQLNQLPAIIVYPQPLLGKDKQRAWQGAPYSNKANDISFVKDILNDVSRNFCVNPDKVFSVGFSNGGGLSWMLSCSMSEQFHAFAMIAGAYYYPENKCQPQKARSILNIHGHQDTVVPYNGSKRKHLPSIDSWVSRRSKTNGCPRSFPVVNYFTSGVKTETWSHCRDDTNIVNIELENSGHTWPLLINDNNSTRFTTTTQYVWQFFENS